MRTWWWQARNAWASGWEVDTYFEYEKEKKVCTHKSGSNKKSDVQ